MDAGVDVELVRQSPLHHGGDAPAVPVEELRARMAGLPRFAAALYQFSRPHTMLGTFVSIVSVSLLALVRAPRRPLFLLPAYAQGALPPTHLHLAWT